MRRCVLILLIIVASFGLQSCAENAPGTPQNVPELIKAVPSDALCLGLFSRLDNGLETMVDSSSLLRTIDYGRLARSHAAIALCDVGSIAELLIIEAGRTGSDTLEIANKIMVQADSLKLSHSILPVGSHNALLLSTSSTVITIAGRHVASESSILDAPYFQDVLGTLPGGDAVVLRNRGALRLFPKGFGPLSRRETASCVRDAAEWTVLSDGYLYPVAPELGRYFCNFMQALPGGPSKLQTAFPEGAAAVFDIPLGPGDQWRKAYEAWLDANIELEQYEKRIQSLSKASGKNPLDWEKEQGVKEIACVMMPDGTVNMVRTSKAQQAEGVQKNPYAGFVRALYGSAFNASDSLCLRNGSWLISGSNKTLLDSLKIGSEKPAQWPSSSKVVAWSADGQINWTKDNIRIWDSNR